MIIVRPGTGPTCSKCLNEEIEVWRIRGWYVGKDRVYL